MTVLQSALEPVGRRWVMRGLTCCRRMTKKRFAASNGLSKRCRLCGRSSRYREEVLRRAISVLEPAPDYAQAVKDAHVNEEQEDLSEALFLLEARRRESRIASFRSALEHGVSINELSRIWGFSRQMASRYAKEARGET